MTDDELKAAIAEIPYFYHKIELRPGITTPGWAPLDASKYGIPDDFTGKRVLDVGAWDGYWTFEALKRGAAHVAAIDDFSDTCGKITNANRSEAWKTFDLCAKALGHNPHGYVCDRTKPTLSRFECDIEESDREDSLLIPESDVVFMFGVLYHLQNPLLALQRCRILCRESIHIETAILDGCSSAYNPNRGYDGSECCAEFYPNDEYGMNNSNWHVGTLRYWCALVEAAGFKNIESWRLTDEPKSVAECRGFIRATV